MSNRFHAKFHRSNHHTYLRDSNPDTGHDPIASREQPFRGDFILCGALSANAALSAFAGYFYSSYTTLCAFAGTRGAYIHSEGPMGIEVYSAQYTALSALAPTVGVITGSGNIALSAFGNNIGIATTSPTYALSAFGNQIGITTGSRNIALSASADYIASVASSANIALSAFGNQIGITTGSRNIALSASADYIATATSSANIALSAFGNQIGITTGSRNIALSASADYIATATSSANIALSAFGSQIGITTGSRNIALSASADYIASVASSANIALSAFGNQIGITTGSRNIALSASADVVSIASSSANIALSAFGNVVGASISSPNVALSAFGNVVGASIGSPYVAVSAFSDNMAGVFFSNNVALSTRGGIYDAYPDKNNPYYGPPYITKNVFNNRTGIFTENPLSAFHVTGGSYLDGHLTVTGNLSVWGDQTRFDTYVYITSSTEIVVQNNSDTTPALFVSNAGNNIIFEAFDADTLTPALVVDGHSSTPGYVGIGVLSPQVRLDIYNNNGSTALVPQAPANGTVIHSTQVDNAINRILLDSYGTSSRSSFTGRYARGGVQTPTAVQANDVLSEMTGRGFNGLIYPDNSNGRLKIIAAENWDNGKNGTYLSFDSTQIGTSTPREIARFADTGFLGLNVTNPNQQLTVSGSISANGTLSASYIEITPFIGNYTYLPNTRAAFVSNVNSYSQVNHQNLFTGASASSDFIATTDIGTDSTGYIDLGINNSGFSQSGVFDIVGANDGYLYTQGGNLAVGTGASKNLVFFTGGTLAANERMRIDGSGNINLGNNGTATLTVKGQASINTTGSASTNIATGTGTLALGNSSATTNVYGSTVSITAPTTISGNSTIANTDGNTLVLGNGTGSTTLSGSIITLGGNATLNGTNLLAPNQSYQSGSSILNATIGDSRYNTKSIFSTTRVNVGNNNSSTLLDAVSCTLLSGYTYQIDATVVTVATANNGAKAEVFYSGQGSNISMMFRGAQTSSSGIVLPLYNSVNNAVIPSGSTSGIINLATTANPDICVFSVTGTMYTTTGGNISIKTSIYQNTGSITNQLGAFIKATPLI